MDLKELTTFEIIQTCWMLFIVMGLISAVRTLWRIEDKMDKSNNQDE